MLRYLLTTLSYEDILHGMSDLDSNQLNVLLLGLSSMAGKTQIVIEKKSTKTEKKIEVITGDKAKVAHVDCCIHCGSIKIKKHGKTSAGVQRYICKDCNKSFTENYGLPTYNTHLREWQWLEAINCFVGSKSLTTTAKNMKVSVATAWNCRMKIIASIQDTLQGENIQLSDKIEVDGKYFPLSFKGCKDFDFFIDTLCRIPRHHRTTEQKRNMLIEHGKFNDLLENKLPLLKAMLYRNQKKLSGTTTISATNQRVCTLTAIDSKGQLYIEPITLGIANAHEVKSRLEKIISNGSTVVMDGHFSYKYYINANKGKIGYVSINGDNHKVIASNVDNAQFYNLGKVNSMHSAFELFINYECGQPATKYIDMYASAFQWKYENKSMTEFEMITTLKGLITGELSSADRAKLQMHTRKEFISRPFPINTKGYF